MFKRLCLFLLLYLFAEATSLAQTPVIGYSDPLISINFDAGAAAFGPGYPPGYTDFAYAANVPSFGSYTRINTGSVNNDWWPCTDHTSGDGNNGYMFVAKPRNGISNQVLFYQDIFSVCSGTQYELSARFLNLSKTPGGVQPEIALLIVDRATGNPIAQTGGEALAQLTQNPTETDWKHLNLAFPIPVGVANIRFLIICKTPGGVNLNDFAVDDVVVYATGQKIDIQFTDGPPGNTIAKTTCAATPEPFNVNATPPEAGNVIRWQVKQDNGPWREIDNAAGETYTIMSPQTPGRWSYRAASGPPDKVNSNRCNVVSNEIYITVTPEVVVSAGPKKFYLRGGPGVVLEGSSNSTDLEWTVKTGDDISSLSDVNIARPVASPNINTTYILRARADGVNYCGPDVVAEVSVTVADDVRFPNTFTPNGDGVNDNWVIDGINSYPNPVVRVYNRNGQLIYRSAGTISPWDGTYNGKAVPAGNYYYIIELGLNRPTQSGWVAVLR